MYTNQALSLATKGMLGGTVPLVSMGYLVAVTDFVYIPPVRSSGRPVERIPLLKPLKHLPKLVTISVLIDGELYKQTVVIPIDMEVSAEDISIKKLPNNQIRIIVNQPKSV